MTKVKTFQMSVKLELLKRGMSVTQLASRVQRNRSTVSTALRGDRFPLARAEIARVLNLKSAA